MAAAESRLQYQMLRDSAASEQTIDKALELSPNSLELWGLKIQFAIEQHGDFSVYEHALATLNPTKRASPAAPTLASASDLTPTDFNAAYVEVARLSVLILQRKFQEAISAAEK